LAAFETMGIKEEDGKSIIKAIVRKEIPELTINY